MLDQIAFYLPSLPPSLSLPLSLSLLFSSILLPYLFLFRCHCFSQVQTIGDGYMAVSGTPIETAHHAEYITNFAFSLLEAVQTILDPSTNKPIQIRIGQFTQHLVLSKLLLSVYKGGTGRECMHGYSCTPILIRFYI